MKKRMTTQRALLIPLTAMIMALWLICMGLLTIVKARKVPEEFEDRIEAVVARSAFIMNLYEGPALNRASLFKEYIDAFRRDDVELAMMLYKDHEPYMTTENYCQLEYFTAEHWHQGTAHPAYENRDGWIYLDLDLFQGDSPENNDLYEQIWVNDGLEADVIRLTGFFYGNHEFAPCKMAVFNKGLRYPGRSIAALGEQDLIESLDWEVLWSKEMDTWIEEAAQSPDTPTHIRILDIYCTSDMIYGRVVQESPYIYPIFDRRLQEDLERQWITTTTNYGLSESIVFRRFENNVDGYCLEAEAALRCNPLKTAMKQLWFVYLVTLAAAVGLILLWRRRLKQQLSDPVAQLLQCADENMASLHKPLDARWEEPYRLQQSYIAAQQELQTLRRENARLQTALDYAENAETNRRQLVSNITHELKTPLAVIHSYCEGLQAGIAPEKQQKYLDVITSEADRMDAMVLEMLDLSRLEAGKVRLAQDTVELQSLTRGILERLTPLMEVKGLTLEYGISSECPLTADENRLTQVVTNLATNAIKYSPEGGKITINVFQKDRHSHFSIENQSQPLSQEALEKIWESFYRTEQSRTTKGTGLGLPICKAIIELHQGTCHAQNTSTGVEFSFMIP